MADPIWKDKLYNFPDPAKFRIKLTGGSVIYTGTAVKRPGQTNNLVKINDICADYISHSLPLTPTIPTLPVSFDVEMYAAGNWNLAGTISFVNDWSYEDGFNYQVMGMSFPIIQKVAPGQIVPYTRTSSAGVTARVYAGGSSQQVTMSLPTDNGKFTDSFLRTLACSGWGGVAVDLSSYNTTGVKLPNDTLCEVDTCIRYVLYYINAYGGMDWFPILGNYQETDSVEHTTYDMAVNNTYRTRGRRDVQNIITKSLTLHSGWLTDEQSAMMHHLLNSPEVFLHDMWTQKVNPVLVTDASHEYQTFKGNGGKPVQYAISVEFANKTKRR